MAKITSFVSRGTNVEHDGIFGVEFAVCISGII
jgi:hypothetical protein